MKRNWRFLVSSALLSAGLGWVVYLFATSIKDPILLFPEHWGWLGLATVFLVASLATNIVIFHLFLNMQTPVAFALSARLYLVGQLLRYLPGRVWGIVYQIGVTKDKLSAPNVIRANLDMMVFVITGNIFFALIVIGYSLGWPIWFLAITGLIGLSVIFILFSGLLNQIFYFSAQLISNKKIKNILYALTQACCGFFQLLKAIGCFLISWSLYLPAWKMIGMAYPIYKDVDFVSLSAFYTLASIVGIVSSLTPAGLGVRESVFIFLARINAQSDIIAFIALFGRIWLILAETALFFIFLALNISIKQFNSCRGCRSEKSTLI